MKISDLMQTDLATNAADASLGEALTMLVDAHVLALPALDAHGKFVGVLSTSDLLEALADASQWGCGSVARRHPRRGLDDTPAPVRGARR